MTEIQQNRLVKIKNSKLLNQLKEEFLEIGITFPKDELLEVMPRMSSKDAIKWFDGARNYWNNRNTYHDMYYKYFKKALSSVKSKVNV